MINFNASTDKNVSHCCSRSIPSAEMSLEGTKWTSRAIAICSNNAFCSGISWNDKIVIGAERFFVFHLVAIFLATASPGGSAKIGKSGAIFPTLAFHWLKEKVGQSKESWTTGAGG